MVAGIRSAFVRAFQFDGRAVGMTYQRSRITTLPVTFIVTFAILSIIALWLSSAAHAATISGTVTDQQSGAPLGGIAVWRWMQNGSVWYGQSAGMTGVDGTYAITGLAAGNYRVQFVDPSGNYVAESYGGTTVWGGGTVVVHDGVANDTGIDGQLSAPAARIEGTLTDQSTGLPLSGVSVLGYQRTSTSGWDAIPGNHAFTDESGRFSLGGLSTGVFRLSLYKSGYSAAWYSAGGPLAAPTDIRTVEGQVSPGHDMALAPATMSIAGTVIDDVTGLPVDGMAVSARPDPPLQGSPGPGYTSFTYGGGAFTVPNLLPGPHKLYVSDRSASPTYATAIVGVEAGTTGLVVRIARGGSISGVVTEKATGAPLAGISAYAYEHRDGVIAPDIVGITPTGADGSYTVGGLTPGTYRVVFRDTTHSPRYWAATAFDNVSGAGRGALGQDIVVAAGGSVTGVDAELIPGGRISGRVTELGTGLPVPTSLVELYVLIGDTWMPYSTRVTAPDSDGNYVIGGLFPGRYRVRFYDTDDALQNSYYPGVPTIEDAQDVVITEGLYVTDIDGQIGAGDQSQEVQTVPAGQNVAVAVGSVDLRFDDAGLGGTVTVRPTSALNRGAPSGFSLLGNLLDISTTAPYLGNVTVSLPYDPARVSGDPTQLRLYHWEDERWVDITASVDTVNHRVTGVTTSFSPFGVFETQPSTPPVPVVSTPASSAWSLALLTVVVAGVMGAHRSRRSFSG